MPVITAAYRVETGGPNEDRILVERRGNQTIAILCDGAGNGGHGGLAADLAIAELRRVWQAGIVDWVRALLAVDQMLKTQPQGGETTWRHGSPVLICCGHCMGTPISLATTVWRVE